MEFAASESACDQVIMWVVIAHDGTRSYGDLRFLRWYLLLGLLVRLAGVTVRKGN